MIDVVLVDDHPVVRAGLRALLDAEPDLRVAADFAAGEDLVAWFGAEGRADVALVDLRLGEGRMAGAELARTLARRGGPPVLVVTTYGSDTDILQAVEAGATGYLLKDAPTEELTAAVRAAAAGQVALAPAVQQRLLHRMRRPALSLTLRELDVLRRVAAGRSNDEVAADLHVTRATVKSHLAHVYVKLGVQSRTEAIASARDQGLLPD